MALLCLGLNSQYLATFGEVLGQRIRTGAWSIKGFGVIPKMIVWYVLGVLIKAAFVVFSVGAPVVLNKFLPEAGPLATAFSISLGLNLIFAPIFMTLHKITDLHIADHHGSMVALIKPINMAQKFSQIDWNTQYGFVFKKKHSVVLDSGSHDYVFTTSCFPSGVCGKFRRRVRYNIGKWKGGNKIIKCD
ncbi:hypothetical protein [Vibrio diabolicus]|uniref:hypothetical protein n=1 Tax=Vibrio diabolicus TaxID=50719 RepID=UPI001C70B2A0|nr:hypothetical protein [Vibrio diabolicus]